MSQLSKQFEEQRDILRAQLREELMVRLNRMLPSGQIARVCITEFVVQ